jgi:hypothetical protein
MTNTLHQQQKINEPTTNQVVNFIEDQEHLIEPSRYIINQLEQGPTLSTLKDLILMCDPFSRAPHRRWVLGDGMQKKDTKIPPERAVV